MVHRPDERAGALIAVDRLFVALDRPVEVAAQSRKSAKRTTDAAHAHERAGGDDDPIGERLEQLLEIGTDLEVVLGFRMGVERDMSVGTLTFRDKDTYSTKRIDAGSNIRIVPGGSSVRDGVYLGPNVTCMPPMYINVGAYVDEGTMVDSHALVGSCAQIGKRCHISAASQIGGVLEPIGALPVIIEDDVLVGGNCGVYEGTIVKRRAVLGTGTILNRSTPVYDLVRNTIHRATATTTRWWSPRAPS